MASGRFISKTISENEVLADLGIEAALLFTWMIPHLDRDGRMSGNPRVVAGKVAPLFLEELGEIDDLLGALDEAGLIRWYEVDGKLVIEFPKFAEHQKGLRYEKEAESRFPAPSNNPGRDKVRRKSGPTPDQVRTQDGPPSRDAENSVENPRKASNDAGSGVRTDQVRTKDGPGTPEGKGREGKRREEEGKRRLTEESSSRETSDLLLGLHPAALSVVRSFDRSRAVESLLQTRFLDPQGMPDSSIKGLTSRERIAEIVSEALVEYATQAEGRFQAAHFSGFVRRIRNKPAAGATAEQVRDTEGKPIPNSLPYRPDIRPRVVSSDAKPLSIAGMLGDVVKEVS